MFLAEFSLSGYCIRRYAATRCKSRNRPQLASHLLHIVNVLQWVFFYQFGPPGWWRCEYRLYEKVQFIIQCKNYSTDYTPADYTDVAQCHA
jgi:hypothetical protein